MKKTEYQKYQKAVVLLFGKMPIAAEEQVYDEEIIAQYRKELLNNSLYASDEFFRQTELKNSSIKMLSAVLGRNFYVFNLAAFHNSFRKTLDKKPWERLYDQLLHYLGTYGRESLGLEPMLIVPAKQLDEEAVLKGDVQLMALGNITDEEIISGCEKLLFSGMALEQNTQEALLKVTEYLQLQWDAEKIANKEFKMRLYSSMGTVPAAPEEFLRYVLFRQCDTTLLVRNDETIKALKMAYLRKHRQAEPLFKQYLKQYGEAPLASIFLRNKKLFLAFKVETAMRPIINRLRKVAVKYHQPQMAKPLDKLTSSAGVSPQELVAIKRELDKVTIFKKIVALNTCRLYAASPEKLVYKIRNGKAFVKKVKARAKHQVDERVEQVIWSSIEEYLGDKFAGQEFYLPPEIVYTVPTSEKGMLGAVPYGSILSLPLEAIVGIHWFNHENGDRIDLDLSLANKEHCFNWQNWANSSADQPVYSGDMTDAPKERGGASEAFYIPGQYQEHLMLSVNNYNYYSGDEPVPFKLYVGWIAKPSLIKNREYLLKASETALVVPGELGEGHQSLGIIETTAEQRQLIIGAASLSASNVMHNSDIIGDALDAIIARYHAAVTLRELIERCGGKIVEEIGEDTIDLSLDKITKEQMLNLLVPDEALAVA